MKNYFATGCLGVTPRGGCMVTAVCMMLVSIMHAVFENGHLRDNLSRLNTTNNTLEQNVNVAMQIYTYITFAMLGISMLMCFVLLVSTYKNIYKGVLVYIGWNALFEMAHLIILVMSHFEMEKANQPLNGFQWAGLGFRLPLQAFYMVFIVTYVLELMESRGRPLIRRRRVAKKRKAKYPKTPPALKFAVKEET